MDEFFTRRPAEVALAGAFSFRDLGGYRTAGGRQTRYGRVFRSNSLQELTEVDVTILRDNLGLATVLDLRSAREVANDGVGPLHHEPLRYVNLPMLQEKKDYREGVVESSLVDRYLSYLHLAKDSVVKALETIAAFQPIVFHCSAGKDRTGVLAALVLGCLGVESETIVSDYAAGQDAREELIAFLRRRPSYAERLTQLPPSALDCEPETMRQFLGVLEDQYSGARGWARWAGVSEETLRRLEETLLAAKCA